MTQLGLDHGFVIVVAVAVLVVVVVVAADDAVWQQIIARLERKAILWDLECRQFGCRTISPIRF